MKKLKIAFIAMSYVSIPGQFIPHTGMLYVSEYVRKNGFTSDVFYFSNCEVIDALSSVTKFLEYDVVLFPAYDENISNILNYSAELKKMCSDIVIILGGPSATSNARSCLHKLNKAS